MRIGVCYAGDDWIDLPVLKRVGLAVTVPEADKIVKDSVHWVTSHGGGKGAVREICNLVLAAQGLDKQVLDEILRAGLTMPGHCDGSPFCSMQGNNKCLQALSHDQAQNQAWNYFPDCFVIHCLAIAEKFFRLG